jgi:putative transposase
MTRKEYLRNLDEMKEKIISSGSMIDVLQVAYNYALQERADRHLGAVPHERSPRRRGFRNGTRQRKVRTLIGELTLNVPQVRGIAPMPAPFERYQQIERSVLIACYELYFKGVSNRKVSRIIEELTGFDVSADVVSRAAAEIDAAIERFCRRPIEEPFVYLLVDGTYIKARENGKVREFCAYVVCGVTEAGEREVLDVQVDVPESAQTWIAVFHRLKQRGLREIRLLVSDGHKGIQSALRDQYPQARWQRCWVHFLRNAGRKVPLMRRTELFAELKAILNTRDDELAARYLQAFAAKWNRYEALVRQVEEQFFETLAARETAPRFEQYLYTTNSMERIMREIKRRTRVIGVFPNANAALRIVGSVMLNVQEYWYSAQPLFSGNRNRWLEISPQNTPKNTTERGNPISE